MWTTPAMTSAPLMTAVWTNPLPQAIHLDSHQPGNNSFFEYATYRAYEGVLQAGRPEIQGAFERLVGAPYSLGDLERFVHQMGVDRFAPEALPSRSLETRRRALHLKSAYAFKLREIEGLPWSTASYTPPPYSARPEDLEGTIHTGFVRGPRLAMAVHEFWRAVRDHEILTPAERRERWQALVETTSVVGEPGSPQRIAALLRASTLSSARKLYWRLQPRSIDRIELATLSPAEMAAYLSNNRRGQPAIRGLVQALFELPPDRRSAGRILSLLPLRGNPFGGRDEADSMLRFVGTVLHEGIHIQQEFRPALDENFFACELEAYITETALQMINGLTLIYDLGRHLSPFGFVMGLRNFIEQTHLRQRPLSQ